MRRDYICTVIAVWRRAVGCPPSERGDKRRGSALRTPLRLLVNGCVLSSTFALVRFACFAPHSAAFVPFAAQGRDAVGRSHACAAQAASRQCDGCRSRTVASAQGQGQRPVPCPACGGLQVTGPFQTGG